MKIIQIITDIESIVEGISKNFLFFLGYTIDKTPEVDKGKKYYLEGSH